MPSGLGFDFAHLTYAQIFEGEVKNVFVCDNYEMANYLSRATLGDDSFAVDVTYIPCGIGDVYENNQFYRVDTETGEKVLIPVIPTQEQQVAGIRDELTIATEYNMDLDYRMSKQELGL